jgi:hypothetical protein
VFNSDIVSLLLAMLTDWSESGTANSRRQILESKPVSTAKYMVGRQVVGNAREGVSRRQPSPCIRRNSCGRSVRGRLDEQSLPASQQGEAK